MLNRIELRGHDFYNPPHWLELIEEKNGMGTYKAHFNFPDFVRLIGSGTSDDNFTHPLAVDPSGGPFMEIGYKVDNLELVRIDNLKEGIFLIFKENE